MWVGEKGWGVGGVELMAVGGSFKEIDGIFLKNFFRIFFWWFVFLIFKAYFSYLDIDSDEFFVIFYF